MGLSLKFCFKNGPLAREGLKKVDPGNCLLRPELEETWPFFHALSEGLVDDMLEFENTLEDRLKERKFRRESRWRNVNLHSEMILKQKERNAAKTTQSRSKSRNEVMRSTPLNVSREHVQDLLAINAGLDRTSRQLYNLSQRNEPPAETPLQVKNAFSFRKNGTF